MAVPRSIGARLDPLLKSSEEPLFALSGDLRLIWLNPACEAWLGRAASEVLGRVCQARGPGFKGEPADLDGTLCPPPEVLNGSPVSSRTLVVRPDGERSWRRIEFWPFHDRDAARIVILGSVRPDVSGTALHETVADRLRSELLVIRDRLASRFEIDSLIGFGPAHDRLLAQASAASASDVPVWIVGEPGTGKRHLAQVIHRQSKQGAGDFLILEASALTASWIDRELFRIDSESRAGDRDSSLERPIGGTLLIEDVAKIPREAQAKLAAGLDGRSRLLVASTMDPETARKADLLAPELYFALTAIVIPLRPLRERLAELPILAQHALERLNARGDRQRGGFSDEAVRILQSYDWPGNLGELHRVVEDAHGRGDSYLIDADDLTHEIRGDLASSYVVPASTAPELSLDQMLNEVERRLIVAALEKTRRHRSRAAERLQISRPRLYRRMKELGIAEEPDADEGEGPEAKTSWD